MAAESVDYIVRLKDEMSATLSQITSKVGQLEGKLSGVQNTANNTSSVFKKGAALIGGYFAVNEIIGFGKSVVDTVSKFEKFDAVLSNTLGSKSAAKEALNNITDFAAKTPFQVDNLTDAFVRLANQGFTPSMDDLRKLGDLSSSTGKDITQLAEAMIDAQTFEFERLKEFGIKANKMKDGVAFTFKGLTTKVKADSESIRNYILSLGDIKGVGGAMEKISATTGGQLSNLEDSFTSFKLRIGQSLKPVIESVISGLSGLIGVFTNLIKFIERNSTLLKTLAIVVLSLVAVYKLYTLAMNASAIATNLVTTAQKALNIVMSLNPIGLIVAGIVALTAAFIYLWNNCKEFQAFFYGLWGAMKAIFYNIADLGIKVFGGLADIISGVMNFDITSLKSGVGQLTNAFTDFGNQVADGFREGFNKSMGGFNLQSLASATFTGGIGKTAVSTSKVKPAGVGAVDGKKAKDIAGNSRPTNINITINKLIERFDVTANNTQEGATDVKNIIVETLLGAINNANILATGG